MNNCTHEFATKPILLRRALKFHQDWIETILNVALAEVVVFEVDIDLAQIGVEKILACSSRADAISRAIARLRPLVASEDSTGIPAPCGTERAAAYGRSTLGI
jgi:hypothetical protein